MHPIATRNEFVRLRSLGLSLARIGRQLGVSKPTLIAWGRRSRPDIDARIAEDHQRNLKAIDDEVARQLADLTRKHNALKQELLSRAFRDVPTPHVETLAGELRQRIQNLQQSASLVAGGKDQALSTPDSSCQPSAQLPVALDSSPQPRGETGPAGTYRHLSAPIGTKIETSSSATRSNQ
ncbi:MAG TPA: hypothetical protein VNZ64_03605 [Candidatus Acidoferrum sp.]|jgi:hypothetical protein|nr:hypothetical protein [Candidatus Acidoferrum sp.]